MENDLTKENVDAIVNAANSWLRHGGGVSYNNIISSLSFFFFEEQCWLIDQNTHIPPECS